MERRLVTIMAADVVGYSARMELSESETIRQLSALTKMLGEQVGRYSGRVFSRAGDGFLSEFSIGEQPFFYQGGIRTLVTRKGKPHYQWSAFDRSATCPHFVAEPAKPITRYQ